MSNMAAGNTAPPLLLREIAEGSRPLISFCIPVYNEEGNIRRLVNRLQATAEANRDYDFEFVFTDNASEDDTYLLLKAEATSDTRIRVLRFSRNFGFQRSILTNFLNARGEAAMQIDADLQDPPELIGEFLRYWNQGYKVVYGVRRSRPEPWLLAQARKRYYRLVQWLSETDIPRDAGDFRLIDRQIIDQLSLMRDSSPYLRGYIAGLGYPQIGVAYDRDARTAGVSKFRLPALLKLAIDGICSQSTVPLRMITVLGFLICTASLIGILGYMILWLLNYSTLPAGFTTLILLTLLSLGLNAVFIGIIGEYVGRIYDNVRGHPMTIIESRIEDGAENFGVVTRPLSVSEPHA